MIIRMRNETASNELQPLMYDIPTSDTAKETAVAAIDGDEATVALGESFSVISIQFRRQV